MNIIVDAEFEKLLPALSNEELAGLEAALLADGCLHPLVVWEGKDILVDGHNRYRLCQKHNIPFSTMNRAFETRDEAMCWMYASQLARRNLNTELMTYCRGRHYELEKMTRGGERGNQYTKLPKAQNALLANTAKKLGKLYGVDPATIKRDAKVARAIDAIGKQSPPAKDKLLSGEVKVNKKKLEKLAKAPQEQIAEVAQMINSGSIPAIPPEPQLPSRPVAENAQSQDEAYLDSIRKHVTDLKDPDLDRSCPVEDYLFMLEGHARRFLDGLEGLEPVNYPEVYSAAGEADKKQIEAVVLTMAEAISSFGRLTRGDADEKAHTEPIHLQPAGE